jgi:hypothetical protein
LDCIELAHNKIQWAAFVSTVMETQIQ